MWVKNTCVEGFSIRDVINLLTSFVYQTPLLLEVNTSTTKLRDVIDKIVKSKLGMNLPLVMKGSSLIYEEGDDLDDDMVATYAINLDKVISVPFVFKKNKQ